MDNFGGDQTGSLSVYFVFARDRIAGHDSFRDVLDGVHGVYDRCRHFRLELCQVLHRHVARLFEELARRLLICHFMPDRDRSVRILDG